MILEKAKVLKYSPFLKGISFSCYDWESSFHFLVICHKSNIFQVFWMTSLLRLTHFITQSASFTPFSTPILEISHFVLLIVRPEKREK